MRRSSFFRFGGRPLVAREGRDLIRKMCRENPLWGAPRIHGELLKLDIEIAESSVSKYMERSHKRPSHTWRTFLENHAQQLVSIDFFTEPTIHFQVLYVFLVLAHDRRRILHFDVTAHPTADWTGQQLREAFPSIQLPRYLLRDRDAIFDHDFREQLRDMVSAKFCLLRARLGSEPMSNGERAAAGGAGVGGNDTRVWRGASGHADVDVDSWVELFGVERLTLPFDY